MARFRTLQTKKSRQALYVAAKKAWRIELQLAGQWACAFPGCTTAPENNPHHVRGRAGTLEADTRFFVAICRKHHNWVHNNIAAARALGLFCAHGLWNTPAPLSPPPATAERPTDTVPSGNGSPVKTSASPSATAGSDGGEN